MFERFTGRARRAVLLAQDEAACFGHDYLGTEHILIGPWAKARVSPPRR